MGLSSSTTTQSNDPWAPAQPYIIKGLQNSGSVFDAQQPQLNKFGQMQMDQYTQAAPGAQQGVTNAQNLTNDTLNGNYLNGNPYMDAALARTREDVTNQVGSAFESSGRYGSGAHAAILSKQLADSENAARMGNYDAERNRQVAAVGSAQGLANGATGLLNNAAELPWIGVGALNGNVRQASNGYGTTTTQQNPSLGSGLMGLAAGGLNAYASNPAAFSDRRLKTEIGKIGEYADGLGKYVWRYIWGGPMQEGVMADEVAKLRPWALGPTVYGYSTVCYGKL